MSDWWGVCNPFMKYKAEPPHWIVVGGKATRQWESPNFLERCVMRVMLMCLLNGGGVKCRVVKSEGSKSLSEQIHASWHVSFGASKGDLQ